MTYLKPPRLASVKGDLTDNNRFDAFLSIDTKGRSLGGKQSPFQHHLVCLGASLQLCTCSAVERLSAFQDAVSCIVAILASMNEMIHDVTLSDAFECHATDCNCCNKAKAV